MADGHRGGNNRIQILDQDGELLKVWTRFGRPNGVHIDADDRIYVAAGMSTDRARLGRRPPDTFSGSNPPG